MAAPLGVPASALLSLMKTTLQSLCQWAGLGAEAPSGKKTLGRQTILGSLVPNARVKPEALAPPPGLGQNYNVGAETQS